MEELKSMHISLVKDRGILKYRVNLIKENVVFGWLKPINNF